MNPNANLDFPILSALIFLPLIGAAVVAVVPESRAQLARAAGFVVACAEAALAGWLVAAFHRGEAGFQFISHQSWIGNFGISWYLGVDGISLFLVAVTALVFPVAMIGPTMRGNTRAFMGWMLLLEAACMGTFLSLDLFLFFIMFEVTLVPGYFLVSGWGGFRRNYAAMKFFIYTFAGSAFLLVAILSLVFITGRYDGRETFDLFTLTRYASHIPLADQKWIFAGFALAFAVKIPLVPLHSWLPDAYSEAPTAGSMVLAGILFLLGAYGLLRFGVFMFPRAAIDLAPVLLTLAAIGIVYGSIVTIMQRDLKRLIAYASIADVAFIVLGEFAFTSQAGTGAVLEMVNHGLTTGALFFVVGMLWERRRTLRFSELGGLQRSMPVLAAVFLLVVMSAVGLPGLNGFVGEFLVLAGTFITHRWWAVVGTSAVVLGAIYLLWAYQRVFHGPLRQAASGVAEVVSDISWREAAAIAPLLAGIIFLGVYPKPFLDRVTPSVDHLYAHVSAVDPTFQIPSEGRPVTYAVPPSQNVDTPVTVTALTGGSARGGGAAQSAAAGASR